MRKRLILIAAIAALGVAFFAVTFFFRERVSGTICEQFITYVRSNNADGSYRLFSEETKSSLTPEEWRTQANDLSGAFYDSNNTPLKSKNREVVVAGESGEDQVTETYVITAGSSRYLGTCYIVTTENGTSINAFRSQASFDPEDYQ